MADAVQVVATDDPVRPLFSAAGELTAAAISRLDLDPDALRDLYRMMVLIRRADQEALNLQRQGELGLWGQYLGQEAIHVGAVAALQADDWIFPSYREFGMAMCRGIDPAEMLTWFRGLSHGPWDPRKYHFVPLARQTAGSIAERAQGYGFPGIRIDGNDVLGVFAAVRAAADRARRGEGPYLIEAMTYRMGAHTSSDDPTRYRMESELQAWSAKDPIARYRSWLQSQRLLDDAAAAAIEREAEKMAEEMRTRLRAAVPSPAGDAIFWRGYRKTPQPLPQGRG